jgi:TolA-binding protein
MVRTNRWFVGAIAAALGLGTLSSRGAEESPAATRQYAVAAAFQGRKLPKLAAEEWRKFLADFPNDPRRDKAQHALGVCLMDDGQLDAGIRAFQALVASSPKYEQLDAVYLNLGVALSRRARSKKSADDERAADKAFADVIQEFPKSGLVTRALFNRAEGAFLAGRLEDAVGGYMALIRDHPKDEIVPEATYALGIAQDGLKRPADAAKTFADFAAKFPTHALAAECLVRRAEATAALKKFPEAEILFKQAAGTKGFAYADYALLRQAACLQEQGKTDEAARVYESLATTFPKSPLQARALLAAGQCRYRSGDYSKARAALAKAAEFKGPEAGESAYWTGRCLLKEKKPADALAAFEAGLSSAPVPTARPLLSLGRADATAAIPGRKGDAAKRYAVFAKEFPDHTEAPQALSLAAFAALEAGESAAAKTHAADFLARYPHHALRPEALFALAEAELRLNRFEEAAARFRELTESAPNSPRAEESRVRRGLALSLQRKHDEAIGSLSADLPRLKTKALVAEANSLIGRAHAARNEFDAAVKALNAALEAKPDWSQGDETRLVLAHCLLALKRPADAESELKKLIAGFPKSPILDRAYLRLAECAWDQGRLDAALTAYRESARRASNGPAASAAWAGVGRTLYRQGNAKGAVEAFDMALRKDGRNTAVPRTRYFRALAEHQIGKETSAIEDVDAFLASKPEGDESFDARFLKGLCQAAAGQQAGAVDTFAAILKERPGYAQSARVEYELAFSQTLLKRDKEAAETFRRVATTNPSGPLAAEAWFRLGELEYAAGRFADAAKDYANAAVKGTDAALKEKAQHKLGWCAFKQKDFAGAAAAFDRQVAEAPGGSLVHDGRYMAAESEFQQAHWRAALDRLLKVIDAKPPAYHARALHRAGQCAGQLKDWSASATYYKDLLAAAPKFAQAPEARYGLGWALQNLEQYPQAIDAYQQVTRETDTETAAKAQFMIGECLFAEKRHADAAPQFLKAAYGYPYEEWAGNAHFEAARCFEILKQGEQARESYRVLAEKYPKHPKAKLAAERLKELESESAGR